MILGFAADGKVTAILVIAVILGGCSNRKVFSDGENETKPKVTSTPNLNSLAADEDLTNFHGFYHFLVRRKGKDEVVCKGEAEIISKQSGTITRGKAPCTDPILKGAGVKEIEIDDDPNKVTTKFPWEEAKKLGLDPRISRIKSTGDTVYNPYLPDLIGPVIQDPRSYSDIDETTNLTVWTKDKKGQQIESSGSVHIKVIKVYGKGDYYRPEGYFESFDEVIHYHINATGFDKLPNKSDVGLYEKFEYHWSTQPIAILNVHIEGPVKDFEDSKFRGFAGNILFGGGIVIDLVLKEHVQFNN